MTTLVGAVRAVRAAVAVGRSKWAADALMVGGAGGMGRVTDERDETPRSEDDERPVVDNDRFENHLLKLMHSMQERALHVPVAVGSQAVGCVPIRPGDYRRRVLRDLHFLRQLFAGKGCGSYCGPWAACSAYSGDFDELKVASEAGRGDMFREGLLTGTGIGTLCEAATAGRVVALRAAVCDASGFGSEAAW